MHCVIMPHVSARCSARGFASESLRKAIEHHELLLTHAEIKIASNPPECAIL